LITQKKTSLGERLLKFKNAWEKNQSNTNPGEKNTGIENARKPQSMRTNTGIENPEKNSKSGQ
jgi:hypothetical protein